MVNWHIRAVPLPNGHEAQDWWIANGKLVEGPLADAQELPGGWLLPGGLVDAHVHLTLNFGRVMPHADGSDALVAANSAAQLRAGVLALRDAGFAWGRAPAESADGPRLQRAGGLIAPPGRGYANVCRHVAADDLVRVGLEEVAAGAQWVKILGDFPGPDGNFFTAPSNYPRDTVATLVREVHAAGARVMAHSTGLAAADLIAAGVDSIEHGMLLSADLAKAMADRRIAWTVTLGTAYRHVGAIAEQQTPAGAYIRGQFDRVRDLLPRAVELGVPVIAGTDEIGMGALVKELEYLVRFGLTPTQALDAGSMTARTWLRFPDIRAGQPADLVTFESDPRRQIDALARPAAVVSRGRVVLPVSRL